MLNPSVRQLTEICHYSPSTIFDALTFVLRLKFRIGNGFSIFYWMIIKKPMSIAKSLEISLVKAQLRSWLNFWTGNVFGSMRDNFPSGSWSLFDQEMLQRIRQTTFAEESMLAVFSALLGSL
jgi:hypothetical protein